MKDRIVLLTKDATCKSYFPIYGNGKKSAHRMPNLEELASKGTVFNKFYTAAPSTAMSFISFSTQKNPYQTNHKNYVKVNVEEKNTIFDKLYEMGYDCHIIWEEKWVSMAKVYSECYGQNSQFHLIHVNQVVGPHNKSKEHIYNDEKKAQQTLKTIEDAIIGVCESAKDKLFLWIHLPHVLLGRNCYGSDGDMLDKVIGYLRNSFDDDAIYITADHGNMNGTKGKVCYGFDVYQSAINIPLITPRINNLKTCDIPLSNTHIFDLLKGNIPTDEFVYSDTAYYGQPHRKLAIIHNNYKYIYNKATGVEELYDLDFDPTEECNIIDRWLKDVDRKVMTPLDQVYYYPNWEESEKEKKLLRNEFKRIWRKETMLETYIERVKIVLRKIPMYKTLSKIRRKFGS